MKRSTILKNWPVLASSLIAVLVLAGWQFHIPYFKHALPSDVDLNPLTAVCF
jgi:hypothetical protein